MRKLASLLLVTGLSMVSASPALAARSDQASPPAVAASVDAANWLATQVNQDGYIESVWTPGTPDIQTTQNAVLALAAAGVGSDKINAIENYLEANVTDSIQVSGVDAPMRISLVILGALAAGRDPANFGGVDLPARLAATLQPSGLFGAADATYDGAYRQGAALLALHAVGVVPPPAAVAWLTDQQCADGGWQSLRTDTSVPCPATDPASYRGPDTNSTAMAALALHVIGVAPAVDPGPWFEASRTSDGGWTNFSTPSGIADANSTGLVLQALLALRGTPDAAGTAALLALQVPCTSGASDRGGIAYQADPTDHSLVADPLATGQAIWGLAGVVLPIPYEFRAPAEAPCQAPVTTSTLPVTTSTVVPASTVPATASVAGVAGEHGVDELPLTGAGVAGVDDATLAGAGVLAVLAGLVLLAAARRRSAA